ncbi:MFS transporter [Persicobacter psychrovividus]|uniref:MFS transporter n=1 Tax=Persicobacter psychrovividus TaxID=387638 RepID=A0ABN6LCZ4_9BACT|nr:MFS transporter [Persicobacter psychrovividus]
MKLKKILPLLAAFLVMGFVDIVGVSVGYIKKDFQLSESAAQLIPSMVFIWFLLLSLPAGIAQLKWGKRNVLLLGILLNAVACILPIAMYEYSSMLVAFAVLGAGNTLIQVSVNPLMMEVNGDDKLASWLSAGQILKSAASFCGPVLVAFFAFQANNWRLLFALYGGISLLVSLWLLTIENKVQSSAQPLPTFASCFGLLKLKPVRLAFLSILLCVGLDVGMYAKISSFLVEHHNQSMEMGSLMISIYFLATMGGRFLTTFLLQFVKERVFFLTALVVAFAGFVLLFTGPSVIFAQVGIVLLALGAAPIFPVVFAKVLREFPQHADPLSGLMIMAVSGGAVVPPIMGYLTDTVGHSWSLCALLFCIAVIFSIALFDKKKLKVVEEELVHEG